MCAAESCGSLCGAQSSTYRHVSLALFPCHSRISPPYQNPKLFAKVIAQFAGRSLCHRESRFIGTKQSGLGGDEIAHPDEAGLAMMKSKALGQSGNYTNPEVKYEDNA